MAEGTWKGFWPELSGWKISTCALVSLQRMGWKWSYRTYGGEVFYLKINNNNKKKYFLAAPMAGLGHWKMWVCKYDDPVLIIIF